MRYRIHLATPVEASDPVQAAERAMEAIKSGHVAFGIESENGETTRIDMSGDTPMPFFRVVGLDEMFSPKMAIFQAEDTYAARENAVSFGIVKVIHVEETLLTDDTEAEILEWVDREARNMAGDIKVATDSAWGNYGTITLVDDLGQMQMREYTRVGNGQDAGLVAGTTKRVLSLCAQKLIERGKCIRVNQPQAGLLKVCSAGAELFVDPDTGEVRGWRAWSMDGLRLAQHVLIVDVLGGAAALAGELDIEALNYWTTTGDLVRHDLQHQAGASLPGAAAAL